jgi:SSS family solute:Na+ symporter
LFAANSNLLSAPDYVIVVVYLLGTLALGFWIGRRIKTGSDYFLGGRRLPWWAIGMSLVATDIGGTDMVGVGGAAYKHGLAVANFEWIGCVPAMILGAFVFIPFFYRTGVFTIPEYLERRYNVRVRTTMATCWIIFMACNMGIMLLASAKMMAAVFGWDPSLCIWATALMVGVYTCMGGLAAVVYTDMIQCTVMIVGCLCVLTIGLVKVGGIDGLNERLAEVQQQRLAEADDGTESTSNVADADDVADDGADADDVADDGADAGDGGELTSLILPADSKSPFPWPGIYFGLALILSPAYWLGNQAIVQRSLGARSEFDAKASYIWGAVLKNLIPLIIVIPGLLAIALLPELEDGDKALPSLVNELLPIGLRGLFVAAFLAALMSSIDSYLNSAATIVTNDFYKRFFDTDISDTKMLRIGRITTAVLVVWAIGFAFLLTKLSEESGIYSVFQTLMAFFQGPALAVLGLGVFWKRANGNAAFISLLLGIATSISLYILSLNPVTDSLGWQPLFQIADPFLYFSVWAFAVTATSLVLLSLWFGKDADEKTQYVFGSAKQS